MFLQHHKSKQNQDALLHCEWNYSQKFCSDCTIVPYTCDHAGMKV